jgi:HK97 family phage portal protein
MFVTRYQAGSPDDRSAWGDFWFSPVNMRTASGVTMTTERAMQLTAVFSCVRVRAESFSVMPLKVYRKSNGKRTLLHDHWLYQLFKRPNPYQNGFEWRQMCQGHLDLRGNCYNLISTDRRGNITSLLPLHPDRIRVTPIGDFDYVYKYTMPDGSFRTYSRADVWHLRTMSLDGYCGMSPIGMAREAIALGLAAQEYGARFFQNDTKSSGIISMPTHFKDKTAREQFRESFQEAQTGINRHKTPVLEYGMTYTELGATNKDSQFLEARQFSVTDIARIYRVPPHLIGDLTRATFTNIEQQSLDFVNTCMTPTSELWEASIETDMLLEDEADIEAEFDFARLLRGDQAARGTFYHNGIMDGWMTRNEARESEGREPLDGLDEPLVPLNMVEDSKIAGGETAKPGMTAPPQDDETGNDDGAEGARLRALLAGNARRMARRMMNSAKFLEASVLAEALAISDESAERWLTTPVVGPRTEQEWVDSLMALAAAESANEA